jgi:hypothetical protein
LAAPRSVRRVESVASADQLRATLAEVRAGDAITLAPGSSRVDGPSLDVNSGGKEEAPIVLRAERPAMLTLLAALLEGFHLRAPPARRSVIRRREHGGSEVLPPRSRFR